MNIQIYNEELAFPMYTVDFYTFYQLLHYLYQVPGIISVIDAPLEESGTYCIEYDVKQLVPFYYEELQKDEYQLGSR